MINSLVEMNQLDEAGAKNERNLTHGTLICSCSFIAVASLTLSLVGVRRMADLGLIMGSLTGETLPFDQRVITVNT